MSDDVVAQGARIGIPEWPGYFADIYGQIWSRKYSEWRLIRQQASSNGRKHLHVELSRGSRASAKSLMVHRLICAAFHGAPKAGQIARHLDDNPINNVPWNLGWGTHKDNAADMIRNGHSLTGEKNHHAKLKTADIIEIRRRRESGESYREIAECYNVTETNTRFICNRRTWRHIR